MTKEKFEEQITKKKVGIITREEYSAKIQRILALQNDHALKKENNDYKMLEKFEVLELNIEGVIVQKLVKRGTQFRLVCFEDLYNTIHQAHLELGHSGRDKMWSHCSKIYANITQVAIAEYLALCETCQLKKPAARKGVVVKPIVSNHMNSRCQADLIDMQSDADQGFRYILTYQDHLTKFCVLRPLGIKKTGLPDEAISLIYNEEQLATALSGEKEGEVDEATTSEKTNCVSCGKACSGAHRCQKCQQFCHQIAPCANLIDENEEGYGAEVICRHCSSEATTSAERSGAKQQQQLQAEKMLRASGKRFPTMEVGSTVMVPIPDVDRGRAEFPNVKAVVVEVDENGMHKLGTEHGLLAQRYAPNQFTPCKEKFLGVENVPPGKEISLREAARLSSMGDGQGFFKCGCTKGCDKQSCKCYKNNKKCNSKCHNSNPCNNKNE